MLSDEEKVWLGEVKTRERAPLLVTAEFIMHARQDIPRMRALIDRLARENERLAGELKAVVEDEFLPPWHKEKPDASPG